jgi:hypothetical protein
MHKNMCPNYRGVCDAMKPIDGERLKQYLLEVHFTGMALHTSTRNNMAYLTCHVLCYCIGGVMDAIMQPSLLRYE